MTAALLAAGEEVVVLDNLSTGDRSRVPGVPFVEGTVLEAALVHRVLQQHDVRGVVHIAAKKQVEESTRRPLHYYRENVEGLRTLLEAATNAGVSSLVFSSSAAVYGAVDVDPVPEDAECRPMNPYGTTKLVGERMIAEVAAATGLRYAVLRYFNVVGAADPALADTAATNLLGRIFERLRSRQPPQIFGNDYATPDGTCIRDYIHVTDIASAHVAAGLALADGEVDSFTANVGRGEGTSVRQMIDAARAVTGTDNAPWAEPEILPRRAGDPPRVVASARRISEALGWRATLGVPDMVESAWAGWVEGGEETLD